MLALMRGWLCLLAVAAVGCTVHNPEFAGSSQSFDLSIGNSSADDLAGGTTGSHDMASGSHDMASTDMTMSACGADSRRCAQTPTPTSEVCSSGIYVRDRVCPFGSGNGTGALCQNGYCRPPTTSGTTSCGTGGPLEQVCAQMNPG